MDYVLFGMGYGSTLMLLGWALRTFGPERKYKDVNPEDIDRTVAQRRWVRFIQGLGGVIAIAGTAMVLFTFIVMLVNPDDETGSFIALVTWGFLAVAVLIWCWFYVSSFGLLGIWSRREGYGFRKRSSYPEPSAMKGISTARVVPSPIADDEPLATDETFDPPAGDHDHSTDAATDHSEQDLEGDSPEDFHDVTEAMEDEEPDETSEPEYDFGDGSDTTVPSEIGGRSEAVRRLRERQARSGNSTS